MTRWAVWLAGGMGHARMRGRVHARRRDGPPGGRGQRGKGKRAESGRRRWSPRVFSAAKRTIDGQAGGIEAHRLPPDGAEVFNGLGRPRLSHQLTHGSKKNSMVVLSSVLRWCVRVAECGPANGNLTARWALPTHSRAPAPRPPPGVAPAYRLAARAQLKKQTKSKQPQTLLRGRGPPQTDASLFLP